MPTRDSYVGDQAAGTVLTAANFERLAGGWIGRNEVTASQGGITTEVDLTGLTVSPEVNDGRLIRVSCSVAIQRVADATTWTGFLFIKEDGNVIGGARFEGPASTNDQKTVSPYVLRTPSAGVHTYKLSLAKTGGGGTVGTVASATFPCTILVEDLGPAT
jgi:hypothetical protein